VCFKIGVNDGLVSFRLAAKVDHVLAMLNAQTENWRRSKPRGGGRGEKVRLVPKRFRGDRDQAGRVAWRILLDCLRAQLTMAALGQAKVQEALLPWLCDAGGTTLFEFMEKTNYRGLIEYKEGA